MSQAFGPDQLLACYRRGVFPMAEARDSDAIYIVEPEDRAVFPLDRFHVPARLARTIRAERFQFTIDTDFAGVIDACAAPRRDGGDTWINPQIRRLYLELHAMGRAHSVEARQEGALVGGLYGVSLGGAFFGESMFSSARDASKAALVHLVARLRAGGYRLLDAQFWTPHLAQFGLITLTKAAFKRQLAAALAVEGDFLTLSADASGAQLLQSIAQTS